MKVSIAVPTWEAHGRGAEFLDDLVRTVQIQTLTDWEIIVSDSCEGNEVKNVVKYYERNGVNIKYVRNSNDFYWTMMPGWNDDIIRGVNSISSPSVLAFKNDKVLERFDENVRMMMDVELYYHLDKNHGQPFYLMDDLVTNRVHSEQLSSKINSDVNKDNIIQAEVDYCLMKHE